MHNDNIWARSRHLKAWKVAVPIIAIGAAAIQFNGVAFAAAKPVSKPTTSTKAEKGTVAPELLVGRWKWVKSTTAVRFASGLTVSDPVVPKPDSTLTFTRARSKAKEVSGEFSGSDYQGNPMKGTWAFVDGGPNLVLSFVVKSPGAKEQKFSVARKVEALSKTRLVMTADDKMIAKMFEATGGTGDNKVVGGSSYDELVRVK